LRLIWLSQFLIKSFEVLCFILFDYFQGNDDPF
jgi:hypothetical protein